VSRRAAHGHERGREFEVNGAGSSWSSDQCDSAPAAVKLKISSVGANSASTCRHTPHGATDAEESLAITSEAKRRSPCATAASTAARSAQIDAPNEAFSTLHPVYTLPSAVASAAPTRKRE